MKHIVYLHWYGPNFASDNVGSPAQFSSGITDLEPREVAARTIKKWQKIETQPEDWQVIAEYQVLDNIARTVGYDTVFVMGHTDDHQRWAQRGVSLDHHTFRFDKSQYLKRKE